MHDRVKIVVRVEVVKVDLRVGVEVASHACYERNTQENRSAQYQIHKQ